MSTVRAVAWGVLISTVLPSAVWADGASVNSDGSDGSWTYYVTGTDASGFSSSLSNFSGNVDTSAGASTATANASGAAPSPVLSAPPTVSTISSDPVTASAFTRGASAGPADALVNFGSTHFPEASQLIAGTPQPWYLSPTVTRAFGGVPDAAQRASFTQEVLNDVQKTYQLSGIDLKLTTDPSVPHGHTLSVVSGASYAANPNAIGITDVGANGFGFIDKLNYTNDPHVLAQAVAHNVAHELMHAFGVAVHHDKTGQYLDAATASWSMLADPKATFSKSAAADIASSIDQGRLAPPSAQSVLGQQTLKKASEVYELQIGPQPVPEPATVAAWSLVIAGLAYHRRRRLAA